MADLARERNGRRGRAARSSRPETGAGV